MSALGLCVHHVPRDMIFHIDSRSRRILSRYLYPSTLHHLSRRSMTMRLPVLILTMAAAAAASALSDSNATSTADPSSVAALASEQTATTVVLSAVSTPASDASASITPSASVSLSYVSPSNDTGSAQAAQVDLDMKHPTVVLENINDLDTVDCDPYRCFDPCQLLLRKMVTYIPEHFQLQ